MWIKYNERGIGSYLPRYQKALQVRGQCHKHGLARISVNLKIKYQKSKLHIVFSHLWPSVKNL